MRNFWQETTKPILALAPMAGITDSAFRQLCRKYGADVVYSEMASADALHFNPKKTLELLRFEETERPYVVQLFGHRPECFASATRIVTDKLKPDGIDINFGCPAKKVFGHGSGCALMLDPDLAHRIIAAVIGNTGLPVSIKIRSGIRDTTAEDFIKATRDLPYSAVMVHARTYEGGFSGPRDFDSVERAKALVPDRIVLGNGGIDSAAEALAVLKDHPELDGLGIARGAWGRPFIFDEIRKAIASGQAEETYDFERMKRLMIEHAELIWDDKKELGMLEIRKHLAWYAKGFPGAAKLRERLVTVKSVAETRKILAEA